MSSIREAFGSLKITEKVLKFAGEEAKKRDRFFTAMFERSRLLDVPDPDAFGWDEKSMSRGLAPFVQHSAAAPETALTDVTPKLGACAHVKRSVVVPGSKILWRRGFGSLLPAEEETLDYELQNVFGQVARSVELICCQAALGHIQITAAAVPGTTAPVDIDFGVNELGVAPVAGPPAIPGVGDWSDATSKINSAGIKAIVDYAMDQSGIAPKYMIVPSGVEGYLLANQEILGRAGMVPFAKNVLESDDRIEAVLNGLNLHGLTWLKDLGVYKNPGGVATRFMPENTVLALPGDDDLKSVFMLARGYGIIPKGVYAEGQAAGDLLGLAPSPGYYAFATLLPRQAAVELTVGWIGLPINTFPPAVTKAVVA